MINQGLKWFEHELKKQKTMLEKDNENGPRKKKIYEFGQRGFEGCWIDGNDAIDVEK